MKTKPSLLLLSFAAAILLAACGNNKTASNAEETKKIAEQAYVFGLPYVLEYRTMYLQAVDKSSKSYVGFGNFLHYGATTPKDKDVMTPNRDTPYSWVWLDLRTEPWVLTVPPMDPSVHRYYTFQWNDLAGFVLDNVSSMSDGYEGGNYLIVPPTWNGATPTGIKRVIKGETYFIASIARTELLGDDDIKNVREIQKGYKVQPLSKFLGQTAPQPAPAVDFLPYTDEMETTSAFYDCLAYVLQYSEPNPMDKAMLDKIARIGITPGAHWTQQMASTPELAQAAGEGFQTAREKMAEMAKQPRVAHADSTVFGPRSVVRDHYEDRAFGAFVGLFGNVPAQAYYANMALDEQKTPLDGSKYKYTVTFNVSQMPEYKFFWSMTMYDTAGRYLVANPINRYSIGSRTKGIKYDKDGSLTIYIQSENPGPDKESNWLPSPAAPFYSVLRFYGPGDNILKGSWKVPPVVRAN